MRIAFDSQIFFSQRHGGISRYFCKIAGELSGLGEDVRVFCPIYRNAYLADLPPNIHRGIHSPDMPYKAGRIVEHANRLISAAKVRRWRAEVVHETFFTDRGISSSGVPVVVTVYDMIHELFPSSFPGADTTTARKKKAVERADHVICISENTRQDLLRCFGIPPEKVSVTHLAFDPPASDRPAARIQSRKPYILYVGQRSGYKNFGRLLQAYANFRSLREDFDLVAFGGGGFSQKELGEIQSSGMSPDQVRQVDGDDSALRNHYASARLFVYPSEYEGFGLPPLEAISNGCVVASSDTSSMPEVLGDAAEYFDPLEIGSIASALEKAAYNDQRRSELLRNGEACLGRFSWKQCAEETLAIYKSLT